MKKIIKNSILILITLMTLFVITGCGSIVDRENNNKTEEPKNIEYQAEVKSTHYNYEFAGEKENEKAIISSYDELKNYCKKLNSDMVYIDDGPYIGASHIPEVSEELSKYNEEFFQNKSLALVYVSLTSSGQKVQINYAKKENNKVVVEYVINNYGEIGLCVMSAELIVVEVDKDINEIEVV